MGGHGAAATSVGLRAREGWGHTWFRERRPGWQRCVGGRRVLGPPAPAGTSSSSREGWRRDRVTRGVSGDRRCVSLSAELSLRLSSFCACPKSECGLAWACLMCGRHSTHTSTCTVVYDDSPEAEGGTPDPVYDPKSVQDLKCNIQNPKSGFQNPEIQSPMSKSQNPWARNRNTKQNRK